MINKLSLSVIKMVYVNRILYLFLQTSLLQIIKKNVLHICLNVTTYIPSQRYVYFFHRKQEPVPHVDKIEDAFNIMTEFFEFGSINQHPLVSMNKVISHVSIF